MTTIKHKFRDHKINPLTEILVVGTFNPETVENIAEFFYSRQRNYLWKLIPTAFAEDSLKDKSKEEKLEFIAKYKIDFVDLISVVDVNEVSNYADNYLDNKVLEWKEIIPEIRNLPNIKQVCLTRKSFNDIPNIKIRIDEIKKYCDEFEIVFKSLITPARFYSANKQEEWTIFFNSDN
jgi:G:T/U-mismatch repair DNA glycosylase